MLAAAQTLAPAFPVFPLAALPSAPATTSTTAFHLAANPHQGVSSTVPIWQPGFLIGNQQTALGLPVCLYDSGRRSRDSGKERDAETNLDYFGARYFSGAQGRFTSPDVPFADQWEKDPQSWNMYAYARNNPLRFFDPMGRACVDTNNGKADDGTGGGCADAGVDANGRIQSQQVNVTGQAGNAVVAFALNTVFALSNTANDYFAWMFKQRPDMLQNTPTNKQFTGQLAEGAALVGTMMIGPGGGKAPLKLIHSSETLSKTILDSLRKKTTQELVESLKPGLEEALRVKPDGRVMNGNHRVTVLMERGVDVNALPREVVK